MLMWEKVSQWFINKPLWGRAKSNRAHSELRLGQIREMGIIDVQLQHVQEREMEEINKTRWIIYFIKMASSSHFGYRDFYSRHVY